MKTVAELRKMRAKALDQMSAILSVADARPDAGMSEDEDRSYGEFRAEVERLDKDIERRAELTGLLASQEPVAVTEQRQMGENRQGIQMAAFHPRRTADTEDAIYCRYLRSGDFGAVAELRAYNNTDMNVTTAADGEVTVPVGMVRDIVAKRDEMMLAPRLGVRNIPGKGTTVNYPVDNEPDVLFLTEAESATIDQDAPAMTEKAFTLVKYAKYITLTWELLRDEDANLLTFLNDWVGRGWAATHNSILITEALANGTAGLTLDAAAAIGAAEIPELVGKVMPEYQEGAQWLMHPTTFAYLQGLSGNPFYFAPMPAGNRQSLWGYPVNQSSYATALGASVKSLMYGNFNFMGKREGTGLTTLRDPYSVASAGQVRLWFWFDAVYGVLQPEAIVYATHPSA